MGFRFIALRQGDAAPTLLRLRDEAVRDVHYCGRMSAPSMPATTLGFFIASRRKGSPSSWFRITSMKVVTPSACASQDSRSAAVSSSMVLTATPFSPQASATFA